MRRDGRWALPHRLALRTAWCNVMLVLAPGMVVDANGLSVRHSRLAIGMDAGDRTPETLAVHLVGRMRHGHIHTRWLATRSAICDRFSATTIDPGSGAVSGPTPPTPRNLPSP